MTYSYYYYPPFLTYFIGMIHGKVYDTTIEVSTGISSELLGISPISPAERRLPKKRLKYPMYIYTHTYHYISTESNIDI